MVESNLVSSGFDEASPKIFFQKDSDSVLGDFDSLPVLVIGKKGVEGFTGAAEVSVADDAPALLETAPSFSSAIGDIGGLISSKLLCLGVDSALTLPLDLLVLLSLVLLGLVFCVLDFGSLSLPVSDSAAFGSS